MALITISIVRRIWRNLYRKGKGKEDMKTGPLHSTAQIIAIFQTIDDRWEQDQANYKGVMVATIGAPLTDQQVNAYLVGWLQNRAERGNV